MRRLLSVILAIAMLLSLVVSVSANDTDEGYKAVLHEVPRVVMDSWTSACYIASFASVEAYLRGSFGGVTYEWGMDYTWETPIWTYAREDWGAPHYGGGNVGSWTRISPSWQEVKDFSPENLYSVLAGGRPLVIYRSGGHASVLIGYNESDSLTMKNFVVMEIVRSANGWCVQDTSAIGSAADRGYKGQNCCYVNLEAWLEGGTLIRAFAPKEMKEPTAPEPIDTITLRGWNYPVNKQSGRTFELVGMVESPNPLLYARVSVDADETVLSAGVEYEDADHRYFDVRSIDRMMPFDSLADGTYRYQVEAMDALGYLVRAEAEFTVSPDATTEDTVSNLVGEHMHDAIPEYSWDSGVVIREPTDEEDGEILYTCFCGAAKTEVLPMTEVPSHTVLIENVMTDAMTYNITFDIAVSDEGYTSVGYLIGSSADDMREVYLETAGECTVSVNAEETYGILDGGIHFIIAFAEYDGVRYTSALYEAELPMRPAPGIHGDVNCDEKVNLTDVSIILKYIAKWDVVVDTYYADVNGDGKVNLADASKMMKYIAKWDNIVLG